MTEEDRQLAQEVAAFRRAIQQPEDSMTDLQAIRNELIALTELRKKVIAENDVVGRLVAGLRNDPEPPTYAQLDEAVDALLAKVPGWSVIWLTASQGYAIVPTDEESPWWKT